jgi:hypothetical protein
MRDVDVNFTTHFITHAISVITTVEDLKGKRVALGSRESMRTIPRAKRFWRATGARPSCRGLPPVGRPWKRQLERSETFTVSR